MDMDQLFISVGGNYADNIRIYNQRGEVFPPNCIAIAFGSTSVVLTPKWSNELAVKLITFMYDNNLLTMETAERIAYLTQAVLADSSVPCSNCKGTGMLGRADDPDSCGRCRGTGQVPYEIDHAEIYDGWAALDLDEV